MRSLVRLAFLAALPLTAHAGFFPQWIHHGVSPQPSVSAIAAADFTGDGRPDTVTLSNGRNVYLTPTGLDGKPGTRTTVSTGENLAHLAVVDFDGDQKTDVVVATASGLSFVRSIGDGTFAAPVTTALDFAPFGLVAADFTGDGRSDLAAFSFTANVLAVFRGDGAGAFVEASRATIANIDNFSAGDADGDGRVDLLLSRIDPFVLELHYGKGNGTFDPPVTLPLVRWSSRSLLVDLDGDGDGEILYVDSQIDTLTVLIGLGSRTFGAPSVYHPYSGSDDGTPRDLVVADVDSDTKPDVVVTLVNARRLATLPGHGNGSLGAPIESAMSVQAQGYLPTVAAAADFTGDGRIDIAIGSGAGVAILRNANGDVRMTLTQRHATVSSDQRASFQAAIAPLADDQLPIADPPPASTGLVYLRNAAAVIARGTPRLGVLEIEAPPLPVGTHTITAHFLGDDNYRNATSLEVVQHVIAEKTATTLTSSASGPVVHGQGFTLTANVTSPVEGNLHGVFWRYLDGVRLDFTPSGPPMRWVVDTVPAGTHTFQVFYQGNATQPPSWSNVITQVITKDQSITEINALPTIEAGKRMQITVRFRSREHNGTPRGWVSVYEGTRLLAKRYAEGTDAEVNLPPFTTVGTHRIHAVFAGSESFEPSVSEEAAIVVTAGQIVTRRPSARR